MLPDPRVNDQWRDINILWYPARFIKHRPNVRNKEFEFRFLECIQWPLREDQPVRPSRQYFLDQKFCDMLLKVVLQPEQVGVFCHDSESIC